MLSFLSQSSERQTIVKADTIVIDVSFWLKRAFSLTIKTFKEKDTEEKALRFVRKDLDLKVIIYLKRILSLVDVENLVLVSEGVLPLIYVQDIRNKIYKSSSNMISENNEFKEMNMVEALGDWSNMVPSSFIYHLLKGIKEKLKGVELPKKIYESNHEEPGHPAAKIHNILNSIDGDKKDVIIVFAGNETLSMMLKAGRKFIFGFDTTPKSDKKFLPMFKFMKEESIRSIITDAFGDVNSYLFISPLLELNDTSDTRELPSSQILSDKDVVKKMALVVKKNSPLCDGANIKWAKVSKLFTELQSVWNIDRNKWLDVGISLSGFTSTVTDEYIKKYTANASIDSCMRFCKSLSLLYKFRGNPLTIDKGFIYGYNTLPHFKDVGNYLHQLASNNNPDSDDFDKHSSIKDLENFISMKSGILDISMEQWVILCSSVNSWRLYIRRWITVRTTTSYHMSYLSPIRFWLNKSSNVCRIPIINPQRDLYISRQLLTNMTFIEFGRYKYYETGKAVILTSRGRGRGRGASRSRGRGRGALRSRGRGALRSRGR